MPTGTTPSLLVVGADSYTLRACVDLGVDTVLVSGPGLRDGGWALVPDGVRSVFVDDQRNPESVLAGLHRAGLGGHRFDAVLTPNEHALVFSAVLARVLDCRGNTPQTAVLFRDKWSQKNAVREAGLHTARSILIEDLHDLDSLPEPAWERSVLKPVTGVATRLTAEVASPEALRATAARFARADPRIRTFVLEEFVEGDEWLVDGVVRGARIAFASIAAYGQPCLSAVRRREPLTFRRFDPETDKSEFDLVDPVAATALTALGLQDGVFHMELFHQDGELYFSECAARRGSALVQEEVHLKFNVDLAEESVRGALGLAPRLDVEVLAQTVGATYLDGRPGTLIGRPSRAEVLARDGVRFLQHDLPLGSYIPETLSGTDSQVAQAVVTAEDPVQLGERISALRAWYGENLTIVPADATGTRLRAWQRETWPDADNEDLLYRPH
jgi:biotin carboxylase